MKKLTNLKGASLLNAVAQKTINGGTTRAGCGCAGKPQGSKCYGGPNCHCIGRCNTGGGCDLY